MILDGYGPYGSIPMNTITNSIFKGMNIPKSQLLWCEQKGIFQPRLITGMPSVAFFLIQKEMSNFEYREFGLVNIT